MRSFVLCFFHKSGVLNFVSNFLAVLAILQLLDSTTMEFLRILQARIFTGCSEGVRIFLFVYSGKLCWLCKSAIL